MNPETYHRKAPEAISLEVQTIQEQNTAIVIEGGVIVGEIRFHERANLLALMSTIESSPLFTNGPAPVKRKEKRRARPLGTVVDVVLGIGDAITRDGREMQFGGGRK
tara:strand:+ start:241 stop:561 length:321 start_codon:yes stop_codon:yes gene_type:complete